MKNSKNKMSLFFFHGPEFIGNDAVGKFQIVNKNGYQCDKIGSDPIEYGEYYDTDALFGAFYPG